MSPGSTDRELRTVAIAPNWVGDTVMALPVLEALAASGRELTVLARPHLHSLLEVVPSVTDLLAHGDEPRQTVERLRASGCREGVLLPNSFKSAWLLRRAGIPRRWGYRGDLRSPLLKPAVGRPGRPRRHQVEDYAKLLAAMEVPPPVDWTPRLALAADRLAAGRERLGRARIDAARPLVGLFPGAEFGPSKRWPWRRFAELARALRKSDPSRQATILAGPGELWMAVRVHEESGKLHPVIGPDLDLAGLAAVLAHLDLLVTNDSGPMHLAAALGVPCVALFGPTDPRRTSPAGDGHQVLYSDRWCSPCFRRRCPLLHHGCMKDHQVDRVLELCDARLTR